MVIYNCPIFVKVGGWSFTLSPSRHTKFGFNRSKTEKVSPQHILSLGAVSHLLGNRRSAHDWPGTSLERDDTKLTLN